MVHLFTTTANPSPLPGVAIHAIQAAMFGEVAAPALWRVRELRAMLLDAHVTLVHAHGMFSTLAIGGLLAAHEAGIASVTTHHSLLRHSPTLPAAWITYRLFSRRATLVTAVSRAAAADARRASGRADVPVLPNGFEPKLWPARGRESSGVLQIVSVMRLARKKSPHDLIAAVPAVLERARRDVIFTIVGDGPERQRLEQDAQRLGVASHVRFLGACERDRVAYELARSELFVLPSRREAFGIALLEARAAGLPIVATARGGVPEVVEHRRQGLLTNGPQEFADAIVALVNDDALRQQYASASGEGLEAYEWETVLDRHETVYRQALCAR